VTIGTQGFAVCDVRRTAPCAAAPTRLEPIFVEDVGAAGAGPPWRREGAPVFRAWRRPHRGRRRAGRAPRLSSTSPERVAGRVGVQSHPDPAPEGALSEPRRRAGPHQGHGRPPGGTERRGVHRPRDQHQGGVRPSPSPWLRPRWEAYLGSRLLVGPAGALALQRGVATGILVWLAAFLAAGATPLVDWWQDQPKR